MKTKIIEVKKGDKVCFNDMERISLNYVAEIDCKGIYCGDCPFCDDADRRCNLAYIQSKIKKALEKERAN